MGAMSRLLQAQSERLAMLWLARHRLKRPVVQIQVSRAYGQHLAVVWPGMLACAVLCGLLLFQVMPGLVDSAVNLATQGLWSAWMAILTPVLTMVAIFAVTRLHFFSYFNAQTDARLRDYLHGVGLGVADYPGVGWLKACGQTSLSCAVILLGMPLCVGAMCALVNPDRSVVLALDAAFTITSPWQVLRAVFTSTALGGLVAVVQLLRYWPVDGRVSKSSVKRVM